MTKKPLNYSDYLKLEDILNSQELKSAERGAPAHDEMLFIIIHQVYELWFKQVIHELNSVLDIFGKRSVVESDVSLAVARLDRIIEIQKILIDQVRVLETMTAMDFLEFRDDLFPSSGFQSAQFRLLENKLGLPKGNRINYGKEDYKTAIINKEKKQVERSESERSLFELLENWLERTPFLSFEGFDFWEQYSEAVRSMLAKEKEVIKSNPNYSDMVRRMIGAKIGTGGSSGHAYLQATADHYKVFTELADLSTFFIPRSALPELPEHIKQNLGYHFKS